MATYKSDTYTKKEQAAGNAGKYITDADLVSGRMMLIQSELTVPVGVTVSSDFALDFIPAGLRLIPSLCNIVAPVTLGASSSVSLGFTGSTNAIGTVEGIAGTTRVNALIPSVEPSQVRRTVIATLNPLATTGNGGKKLFVTLIGVFSGS